MSARLDKNTRLALGTQLAVIREVSLPSRLRIYKQERLGSLLLRGIMLCCLACAREPTPSRVPTDGGANARASAEAQPPAAEAKPVDSPPSPLRAFEPPAEFAYPADVAADERVPFVLVLHGFGVSAELVMAKVQLAVLANHKRFAYVVPTGQQNAEGRLFWNAGPACCDTDKRGLDDVARLTALLDLARTDPRVDPNRVYVIGHSNGGFMAHRLACEAGDRLAAVISVAGAAPASETVCPRAALAVLEIHGTADPFVHYEGGTVRDRKDFAAHPSAPDTMKWWATQLGCAPTPKPQADLDLEPNLVGAETQVSRYDDCRGAAELWTVRGGAHYVGLQRPAFDAMWKFLSEHPRKGCAFARKITLF